MVGGGQGLQVAVPRLCCSCHPCSPVPAHTGGLYPLLPPHTLLRLPQDPPPPRPGGPSAQTLQSKAVPVAPVPKQPASPRTGAPSCPTAFRRGGSLGWPLASGGMGGALGRGDLGDTVPGSDA